ncbi:MAG: hypothetical protein OEU54_15590 [Gemmatimonadota bacterium]|nr:hypothetical protein [Gemmatimonadota bacterium]
MSQDERVIEVLEEIRDTQRQHFELYQEAVRNQEESIRAQQEAIRFQKVTTRRLMFGLIPLIAIVLGLLLWLTLAFR